MWPPYQKSGSRRLTLRESLWLSWLETFHMHCIMQLFTVSRNPNGWPVALFVYYFLPFCIQGET